MSSALTDDKQLLVSGERAPDAGHLIRNSAPIPDSVPFYKKRGFIMGLIVGVIVIIALILGLTISSSSSSVSDDPDDPEDPDDYSLDPTAKININVDLKINTVAITEVSSKESWSCNELVEKIDEKLAEPWADIILD